MTQPEYEQKKRECWEEFIGNDGIPTERLRACLDFAFDRAYALGKQAKDADTVIQGWMSRDKCGDLFIYTCKPERISNLGYWDGNVSDITPSNDLFPDLTWSDEPEPVEIIIKRKNKNL